MRIRVVAVGKIKEKALRGLLDDYRARIQRYTRFEELELSDDSEPNLVQKIERAVGSKGKIVAMDVKGKSLSSEGFSKFIEKMDNASVQDMSFVIGGSYGLPKKFSELSHFSFSLSALTLPHKLARLVLFEQIYRAYTLLRHEPYSH